MSTQTLSESGERAGLKPPSPRSLLSLKVASLSEEECGEVIEYIEVMRSLRREAARPDLFGDGFARRVASACAREKCAPPVSPTQTSDARA